MITVEQLKADKYQIEYWFNVYSDGYGFKYSTRDNCEEAAAFYSYIKPLYRIHVRMK